MKKTAFLHALILVILLSVSWVLLVLRIKNSGSNEGTPESELPGHEAVGQVEEPLQDPATAPEETALPVGTVQNRPIVPPAWTEWIDFLEQQRSARDMQNALMAMRDTLLSMDPEAAQAHLLDLISSGVNIQTGLRFHVGRGGNLLGANDLQTLLLDWLSILDPAKAAEMGKVLLIGSGESLGADAFVIHLRNYARGTTDTVLVRDRFVNEYFNRIISNPSWTNQPVHSIAEAMDFAVFLQDGSIVPVLSGFMADDQSPALGHAGSMAIERLVDIDPVGSVSAIIESINRQGMSPYARAGFVSRIDPADPRAFGLMTEYLQHPSVSQAEAITFLQFIPNLNKSLSHNLVSPEISITSLGNHMDRLKSALNAVEDWQSNPPRSDLDNALAETAQRLTAQLKGDPSP